MSKIIIPASKKDLPKILEIINHEILTTTSIYDYEPRTLEAQKEWFAKKQKEGMPVLVMKEEEEVLGFGTYGIFRPWPAYQFSLEHSIYVHKDHRGKGVGKALMYELIERASTEGFHTMIAGVDGSNQGSINFHQQMGFKEVGTFKQVGFKFGRWLDLHFLQLFLKRK